MDSKLADVKKPTRCPSPERQCGVSLENALTVKGLARVDRRSSTVENGWKTKKARARALAFCHGFDGRVIVTDLRHQSPPRQPPRCQRRSQRQ